MESRLCAGIISLLWQHPHPKPKGFNRTANEAYDERRDIELEIHGLFASSRAELPAARSTDATRMAKLCALLDRMDEEGNGFPSSIHNAFQEGGEATRTALDAYVIKGFDPVPLYAAPPPLVPKLRAEVTDDWIRVDVRSPTEAGIDPDDDVIAWNDDPGFSTIVGASFVSPGFPEYTHWKRKPRAPVDAARAGGAA